MVANKNKQNFISKDGLNAECMTFLMESPTSYHATINMRAALEHAGFIQLHEDKAWHLEGGKKYYVTRNDSALVAFALAKKEWKHTPFCMIGAHTDSPLLKVKPNSDNYCKNYLSVAVEPYGGSLLATWFDRDLSLAGKVCYEDKKGNLKTLLLDFTRAVAVIPSLAIHLDRQVNENRSINKQKELPPLLMQLKNGERKTFVQILNDEIKAQKLAPDCKRILDYDMYFYDASVPAYIGINSEFIASGRIDNLLSCFAGMKGIVSAGERVNSLLICNDHEECGSDSLAGAGGNFLQSILSRICESDENLYRSMASSFFISADNAHAVHPNFAEKHEPNHAPVLNGGPVVKINANVRYATDCETSAFFTKLAGEVGVPIQKFVARSDMGCGSTIGPTTSKLLGVKTVDIGLPTLAMHSIRELMGADDLHMLVKMLHKYFA